MIITNQSKKQIWFYCGTDQTYRLNPKESVTIDRFDESDLANVIELYRRGIVNIELGDIPIDASFNDLLEPPPKQPLISDPESQFSSIHIESLQDDDT